MEKTKKVSGLKKLLVGALVAGGVLFGANQTREYIKSNYGPGFSENDVKIFNQIPEAKERFFQGLINDAFVPGYSQAVKEYYNELEQAVDQSGENYNPVFDFPYLDPFDPNFEENVQSISDSLSSKQEP